MKIISKIFYTGALATLTLTSCQRDLTSLNVDPKHPTEVPSNNLLASQLYHSSYYMATPSVNYNNYRFFVQYLAETTYTDETNYDLVTRNQPRNHFNRMYISCINPLKSAKDILKKEVGSAEVKANKWATLEIEEIFVWENLVDTYGNIPYSEGFNPDEKLAPKYDDAFEIYKDLIKRLDVAISKITVSETGYASGDMVFNGDMSKWKKFANSIKLRLAMNLADVDPSLSKSTAESAVVSGVMSSNSDTYKFVYDNATFTNPIYESFIASGRNDFVPAQPLVDLMNANNDPRREQWFTTVGSDYVGGVFGDQNPFAKYSHYKDVLTEPTAPSKLLSYVEVLFLKAEAAARGYNVGGSAVTLYNDAVTASMQDEGVSTADATAYLAAHPYDATNWKKSIGEQAYVALFEQAFASWNFNRRLDYPVLINPGNSNLTTIPKRMPYSKDEYQLNGTNVRAAASAIGGDKAETKLFWDKN